MKDFFIKKLSQHASKWVVLTVDVVIVALSFIYAYFVRYDFTFEFNQVAVAYQLPIVCAIGLLSFLVVGSYKGIIRHTGTKDAFNVLTGTLLMFCITLTIVLVLRFLKFLINFNIPVSVVAIHYFTSTFALIVSRFLFKAFYEMVNSRLKQNTTVLIYGAGDSGLVTYGTLKKDTLQNYDIIGFIDDDKRKIGKRINQVKIYASDKITDRFIEKYSVDEVIISIQNISTDKLLTITDSFIDKDVKVKIVPPLNSWIDGDFKVSEIKQVNIEDLLQRAPINVINPIVKREVNNKVVLITGAAGSIGSEIVRQLSEYNCAKIILIDQAESDLYNLQQELLRNKKQNIISIVADICDAKRISHLFKLHRPNKVFHAAAYKHVPLMEGNPYEAIKTNLVGTKNIADISLKYGTEQFVMISTDKAVNPTNIMGATKRLAELYISSLSAGYKRTKFTTTRFGNVLGSNGSVIPLFRKQLQNGGPLTVTHKDITRFFMTIPEACSLVLEAGTMGEGGEIYIFDMGKPIKIFEVARKMIFLSGLRYPEDIDIKITGLRPGEKLYEELLSTEEHTKETYHEKIMIAKTKSVNHNAIKLQIEELCNTIGKGKEEDVVVLMKQIVPEFKSNNSIYEKLDMKYRVS